MGEDNAAPHPKIQGKMFHHQIAETEQTWRGRNWPWALALCALFTKVKGRKFIDLCQPSGGST